MTIEYLTLALVAARGRNFKKLDLGRREEPEPPLPCCGLGHRVGDGPVPQLSSTGAVTSGGSSVRSDPGSGIRQKVKKESATAVDAAGAARSTRRVA
jgi:hypothetical protein